ncbi:uncharacterized protein VTP21DRAFT_5838 [Calcarisporiella thermophila]|uniref:uncharacterized protein n=1 Tax=Calcarisporiella thermophila TaxID=911321 RepID=UPI0037429002
MQSRIAKPSSGIPTPNRRASGASPTTSHSPGAEERSPHSPLRKATPPALSTGSAPRRNTSSGSWVRAPESPTARVFRRDQQRHTLDSPDNMEKLGENDGEIRLGDRVMVESMGIEGVLRFVGTTQFKPGTWAGLELKEGEGKNDGSVSGVKYFDCPPNSGLFVLYSKLTKLPTLSRKRSFSEDSPTTARFGSRAARYVGVTATQLKHRAAAKAEAMAALGGGAGGGNRAGEGQGIPPPSPPGTQPRYATPRKGSMGRGASPVGIPSPVAAGVAGVKAGDSRGRSISGPSTGSITTSMRRLSPGLRTPVAGVAAAAGSGLRRVSLPSTSPTPSSPLAAPQHHPLREQEERDKERELEQRVEQLEMENQRLREGIGEAGDQAANQEDMLQRIKSLEKKLAEYHDKPGIPAAPATPQGEAKAPLTNGIERHSILVSEDGGEKILELTELLHVKEEQVRQLEVEVARLQQRKDAPTEAAGSAPRQKDEGAGDEGDAGKGDEVLERQLEGKTRELDELRNANASLQKQLAELHTAGREAIAEYDARVASLESMLQDMKRAGQESLELHETAMARRQAEADELHRLLVEREERVAELEAEVEELRKVGEEALDAVEELKRDKENAEAALAREQGGLRALRAELDQVVKANAMAAGEEHLKELFENEKRRLVEALDEERKRAEILARDKERLAESVKSLERSASEAAAKHNEVEQERAKLLEQISTLTTTFEELGAEKTRLLVQMEQLQQDLEREMERDAHGGETGQREKELIERVAAQEEKISGLKHLVHELQRENSVSAQECRKLSSEKEKLVESQKKMEQELVDLMEEVEKLHAENMRGEKRGSGVNGGQGGESTGGGTGEQTENEARLSSQLAEKQLALDQLRRQHAQEARELRAKLAELEKAKQREINALNKDVAELETLVENKIFREAELEEMLERERKAVERLREELSMTKMLGSGDEGEPRAETRAGRAAAAVAAARRQQLEEDGYDGKELYCDICEVVGHDIVTCKAVFERRGDTGSWDAAAKNEQMYCANCEQFGLHETADCPNWDETF